MLPDEPTLDQLREESAKLKQENALLSKALGKAALPPGEVGSHPAPAAYEADNVLPLTDAIGAFFTALSDTGDLAALMGRRKLIAIKLYSLEVEPSTNPYTLMKIRNLGRLFSDLAVLRGICSFLRSLDDDHRAIATQATIANVTDYLNDALARRGTWSVWQKSYEQPREGRRWKGDAD